MYTLHGSNRHIEKNTQKKWPQTNCTWVINTKSCLHTSNFATTTTFQPQKCSDPPNNENKQKCENTKEEGNPCIFLGGHIGCLPWNYCADRWNPNFVCQCLQESADCSYYGQFFPFFPTRAWRVPAAREYQKRGPRSRKKRRKLWPSYGWPGYAPNKCFWLSDDEGCVNNAVYSKTCFAQWKSLECKDAEENGKPCIWARREEECISFDDCHDYSGEKFVCGCLGNKEDCEKTPEGIDCKWLKGDCVGVNITEGPTRNPSPAPTPSPLPGNQTVDRCEGKSEFPFWCEFKKTSDDPWCVFVDGHCLTWNKACLDKSCSDYPCGCFNSDEYECEVSVSPFLRRWIEREYQKKPKKCVPSTGDRA